MTKKSFISILSLTMLSVIGFWYGHNYTKNPNNIDMANIEALSVEENSAAGTACFSLYSLPEGKDELAFLFNVCNEACPQVWLTYGNWAGTCR